MGYKLQISTFVMILTLTISSSALAQQAPGGGRAPSTEYESEDAGETPTKDSNAKAQDEPDNGNEQEKTGEVSGSQDDQKKGDKKKVKVIKNRNALEPPEPVDPSFTALGAGPSSQEDAVLRIEAGYPELQALFHIPFTSTLEIAIGGGLYYGLNANTAGDWIGLKGTAEAKWRFYQDGPHRMALTLSPTVLINLEPKWGLGLMAGGPGLVYDYSITEKHHAIMGVKVPWGFFFLDDVGTVGRIPVVFQMGMEYEVADGIHLFVQTETGADIWTGGEWTKKKTQPGGKEVEEPIAGPHLDGASLYVRSVGGFAFGF